MHSMQLSTYMWFLPLEFALKKTGLIVLFLFSLSNKSYGKAFCHPFRKKTSHMEYIYVMCNKD